MSPKSLHPAIVHQPVHMSVGCSPSTSKILVPSSGAVSIGCQSFSNCCPSRVSSWRSLRSMPNPTQFAPRFFLIRLALFSTSKADSGPRQSDGANHQSVGMVTARSYSAGCGKRPRLKTDAGARCHGVGIDPTRGSL